MGIRPICKTTHSRSCLTSTLANKLLLSDFISLPFARFQNNHQTLSLHQTSSREPLPTQDNQNAFHSPPHHLCLPCRRHLSTGPQFPPLGSLLACWHRHRVSITPLQRRLCPEHRHLWSNRRRRISVLLCSLCRWLRNRRRNQHGWIPHKRSWQCRC